MGEEEPVDGEKVFIVRESSGALPYYSAEYSFHPPSFRSAESSDGVAGARKKQKNSSLDSLVTHLDSGAPSVASYVGIRPKMYRRRRSRRQSTIRRVRELLTSNLVRSMIIQSETIFSSALSAMQHSIWASGMYWEAY